MADIGSMRTHHHLAYWTNVVMFATLLTGFLGFGIWCFVTEVGPVYGILSSLPIQQQLHVTRFVSSVPIILSTALLAARAAPSWLRGPRA
jgi:hypothetical protein